MSDIDYSYASASELVAALTERAVSALELTNAAITRIERYDSAINAICVRDFERARSAAQAADAALARGERRPLLGVPITVKESFNVAGLPTTWGIPAQKDFEPAEDALAVARVKAAGAVILGKTNVPLGLGDWQSFNAIYGVTRNPWNLERTPGGSSGGSAAALAAGFGAISLGSDIGGSLRVPAHYCGIYAHKPSLGLLPARGHSPPAVPVLVVDPHLAVIGPMARSARDLSIALDCLADPDEALQGIAYRLALPAPRHTELAHYRVLVLTQHPLLPTAANVAAALERLATQLTAAGARVSRDSPLLPDLAEAARLYVRLLFAQLAAGWPLEGYEDSRGRAAKLDPHDRSLSAELTRGTVLSHRDWISADRARLVLRQRWSELFAAFDIVVCPIMPTTAYPHVLDARPGAQRIDIDGASHESSNQFAWPGVATLPGLPATSIPLEISDDGLPIGVQCIGPMFEDRTPLHFAELLERERGGFVPPKLG